MVPTVVAGTISGVATIVCFVARSVAHAPDCLTVAAVCLALSAGFW